MMGIGWLQVPRVMLFSQRLVHKLQVPDLEISHPASSIAKIIHPPELRIDRLLLLFIILLSFKNDRTRRLLDR